MVSTSSCWRLRDSLDGACFPRLGACFRGPGRFLNLEHCDDALTRGSLILPQVSPRLEVERGLGENGKKEIRLWHVLLVERQRKPEILMEELRRILLVIFERLGETGGINCPVWFDLRQSKVTSNRPLAV